MPLEAVASLMRRAEQGGYAVGYFESWNLESLKGVIDAAEVSRSPVILGFNGEFLSGSERKAPERLALYAALGKAAAEGASIPCSLIFNECPRDDWVRDAVKLGFNLVMPVPVDDSSEERTRRVASLTRYAHERGVAVEGESGVLPHGDGHEGGMATDPEVAASFVEQTGVDLLAVSVGNVHVQLQGETGLDLDRLERIRRRVAVPLVLHGGSGIAPQALRDAIAIGVAKVNYGTYLKQRYLKAVRDALSRVVDDPHRVLGVGGSEDVLIAGRVAVRDAVLERMDLLGCRGRA